MGLIYDLYRSLKARLKIGKRRFLLKETEVRYREFLAEEKRRRQEIYDFVLQRLKELSTELEDYRSKIKRRSTATRGTDAVRELAHRDVVKLRQKTKPLLEAIQAFRRTERRMRWMPWVTSPEEYPTSRHSAPYTFHSTSLLARIKARDWEADKIAKEGSTLLSSTGKQDEYWQRERRLVLYLGRHFLVVMVKSAKAASGDPWEVGWATDSTAQMTEKELRIIVDNLPEDAVIAS